MDDVVSRRTVRHMILRRRNERVAELGPRVGEAMPRRLRMHPDTLGELLTDGDPLEAHTLDFEGFEFMRIPLQTDVDLELGLILVDWPADEVVSDG